MNDDSNKKLTDEFINFGEVFEKKKNRCLDQ